MRIGERKIVGNYAIGRFEFDPVLTSPQNYRLARSWLEDCCKLHEKCPSGQLSKLPTRVIDVGSIDGQHSPRLVLAGGIQGRYAALSHCWGGEISPLLKIKTLQSFQHAIPLPDLPANFRDAISITQQLGIQYLWIDSLCIIQDSRDDWEAESKEMGFIYRGAIVTIAASVSCRSTEGILRNSPDSNRVEEVVSLRLSPDKSSDGIVHVSLKGEEKECLNWLFNAGCPLSRRGWTRKFLTFLDQNFTRTVPRLGKALNMQTFLGLGRP